MWKQNRADMLSRAKCKHKLDKLWPQFLYGTVKALKSSESEYSDFAMTTSWLFNIKLEMWVCVCVLSNVFYFTSCLCSSCYKWSAGQKSWIYLYKHKDFLIRKKVNDIPPLTSPLVQMADMDRAVSVVTNVESRTITDVRPTPAFPVTHDRRMNSITPQIFNRHLTWNK